MLSLLKRPFYGWWIVAGAIVSQFTWMAVGPTVVGVFLGPVTENLGWPVWQFTLGSALSAATSAVGGIIAGEIVDRRGPRLLILVGVASAVLCLTGISRQSNLVLFLALYAILGLTGYNLFGPLVVNATISKWFVARRGWALAVGSIGVSLAAIVSPLAVTFVVDTWGWRTGYATLAVFVLVVVTPVAFVMRRTPEDHGLLPDGGQPVPESDSPGGTLSAEPRSFTRTEALRTRAFWLLIGGFGLNFAALAAVLIHAIPFITDAGFSRTIAATALAVNGLGNLSSKAFWGYGLQRMEPRRLVFIAFSISASGVGLMIAADAIGRQAVLFPGFFLYGFGFGGTIPISEFLWAKYFGRRHIGAIRGIGNPISILGTGVGPVLAGAWFDMTGDYGPAFLAVIAAYIAGGTFIAVSREPSG